MSREPSANRTPLVLCILWLSAHDSLSLVLKPPFLLVNRVCNINSVADLMCIHIKSEVRCCYRTRATAWLTSLSSPPLEQDFLWSHMHPVLTWTRQEFFLSNNVSGVHGWVSWCNDTANIKITTFWFYGANKKTRKDPPSCWPSLFTGSLSHHLLL